MPPSYAPTSIQPAQKGAHAQAVGRSRGGLTSKLHVAVDGLGNPLRVRLTAGQRNEATQAEALIEGIPAEIVIADMAFDSNRFRAALASHGAVAVIPSNPSRAQAVAHDAYLYKERHLVECFINKIKQFRRIINKTKQFRRIATRYEKTARNFLAMISLACAMVWLR